MAREIAGLLEETLVALEHFDAAALEQLLLRAQALSSGTVTAEECEAARRPHRALGELLAATERNLRMLRRLRGEDLPGERTLWAR